MTIKISGKEYEVKDWSKKFLTNLAEKRLKEVRLEKSQIRLQSDLLEYTNKVMELINEENDLNYALDKLSGKPML